MLRCPPPTRIGDLPRVTIRRSRQVWAHPGVQRCCEALSTGSPPLSRERDLRGKRVSFSSALGTPRYTAAAG
jgi:hypothetical protein